MLPIFAIARTVKTSANIYTAVNSKKEKQTLKDRLLFRKNKIININNVDGNAQLKLIEHIEQFVRHKILVDLKNQASFTFTRTMAIAKWILIIGAIGMIAYQLRGFIKAFIDFANYINTHFKPIEQIHKLIKAWHSSHGNVFIFFTKCKYHIYNLKDIFIKKLEEGWNNMVNMLLSICNKLCDFVTNIFTNIKTNLIDLFGASDDTSPIFDENQITLEGEIRDPYDYTKTYMLNDPHLHDGQKLPPPTEDNADNSELQTDGEDPKPNEEDNNWTVSKLVNSVTKITDALKPAGEEVVNTIKGIFDSGDKAKTESNNKIKTEQQKKTYKSETRETVNPQKPTFDKTNSEKFDFKLLAMVDLYNHKFNNTIELKQKINSVFLNDAIILTELKYVLTKLKSGDSPLYNYQELTEINQLNSEYQQV